MRRAFGATGLALAATLFVAGGAGAQIQWEDLVFTGGFSAEGYNGNFSAVTVAVVDSTDHAQAAVGEFGARGSLLLMNREKSFLRLQFDGGLRQFAASGFELRDYAPREWVGRLDMVWSREISDAGRLSILGTARGRAVDDRPPMPLFLQPGYSTVRAATRFRSRVLQGVRLDAEVDVQLTDYEPLDFQRELDLLDRRTAGFEVGAELGRESGTALSRWGLRFYAGFHRNEYRQQDSFDPRDPFRRDRTVHAGALWSYQSLSSGIAGELGLEGTVNRSNSKRPEYDAVSVRGTLSAPLPWWKLQVNTLAVITGKSYVHESDFARLVPGEEADNASVVYIDLNRPMAPNLDGAVRFGWTRAETDIGDTYYSRFGVTFLVNYRPAVGGR